MMMMICLFVQIVENINVCFFSIGSVSQSTAPLSQLTAPVRTERINKARENYGFSCLTGAFERLTGAVVILNGATRILIKFQGHSTRLANNTSTMTVLHATLSAGRVALLQIMSLDCLLSFWCRLLFNFYS